MCTSKVVHRVSAGLICLALALAVSAIPTADAAAGTVRFRQPLGEIRGTAPAQVSFDGKGWIPLGSGTLPAFDKTLIRARSGTVVVTLSDGSRLEASPTTALSISAMGSSTFVRVEEGNVLFRLRSWSSARLMMPGGVIQTAAMAAGDSGHAAVARISAGSQVQRDALGVITAQRGGIPRVRVLSGEALLVSQNGSVTEWLREGQVRTMLGQSSGPVLFKRYAAAQPGGQSLLPPTDPPSQMPTSEHVWTWAPSHPQDVQGGWQEMRLGIPPTAPPPSEELRRGYAWAYKDQWLVAKRECGQLAALRRPPTGAAAQLPPPVDPPSQVAKAEHVWAWHPQNPPEPFGGWQEVKLGTPPDTPPRPDQELYDGFVWAWEEAPEQRWVVVEECGLAAAFLVPAGSGIAALVAGGAVGGAVGLGVAGSSGGGNPVASNVAP